jgi:hypothetical protein
MNKTEIKELAQDLILQQAANAYYHVEDQPISHADQMALDKAIRLQSDRVARLFGYSEQPYTT